MGKIRNGEDKNKAFITETTFVSASILLMLAISYFKLGEEPVLSYGVCNSLLLISVMRYNRNVMDSVIALCAMGFCYMISGVGLDVASEILVMGMVGILIVLIRVLHQSNIGRIDLGDTPIARLKTMLTTRVFPIRTDWVFTGVIYMTMLTSIFSLSSSSKSESLSSVLVVTLPALATLASVVHLDLANTVRYLSLVYEVMVLLSYYLMNPVDLVPLYKVVIGTLLLFATIYSIELGHKEKEEAVKLYGRLK